MCIRDRIYTNQKLSNSNAYVYLYSNTGISSIKRTTGSVSATNVVVGKSAYASASLNNFSSGSHYAYGKVTG